MLDMTPRYVPQTLLVNTYRGFVDEPVIKYEAFPPNQHTSIISRSMTAVKCTTPNGIRWFGCVSAHIDSSLRMVVLGTESRDEVRSKWEIVL